MIRRIPRLSKKKQKVLLTCFIADTSSTQAAEKFAKVPRSTSDRWFRHYRELIYKTTRRAPRMFGNVEVDQAFFGGKNKKKIRSMLKRIEGLPHKEYERLKSIIVNRGRIQVLGIFQRGGVVYTQVIKKADANTLEPILRLVVEKKSTIYSDLWRGYSNVGFDGYKHDTINHSVAYVSQTGANINGIEAFWSFAKRRLAKFNGMRPSTFLLHLKESEFRYNHGDKFEAKIKALLSGSVPGEKVTGENRLGAARKVKGFSSARRKGALRGDQTAARIQQPSSQTVLPVVSRGPRSSRNTESRLRISKRT